MKAPLAACILMLCSVYCFAQKGLISYDDIKYLLHNNLNYADTFLTAKGYLITKKDNLDKNRKYNLITQSGTISNISLRSDGRRQFVEIETNEIDQYNLIRESISQYLNKYVPVADVQSYSVKDLGNFYITINDTVPYNPIKKDYDIQVVGDKHITTYN